MRSKVYKGQSGEVRGKQGSSRNFRITSGVPQACVLGSRFVSALLRWAMQSWWRDAPLKKNYQRNGQIALLDLRAADGIRFLAHHQVTLCRSHMIWSLYCRNCRRLD